MDWLLLLRKIDHSHPAFSEDADGRIWSEVEPLILFGRVRIEQGFRLAL
jgi:hypothetical protein